MKAAYSDYSYSYTAVVEWCKKFDKGENPLKVWPVPDLHEMCIRDRYKTNTFLNTTRTFNLHNNEQSLERT